MTTSQADRIPSNDAATALARRFGDVLCAGDGSEAERVIEEALNAGLPPAAVQSLVIGPAMVRIGELWESQIIGVADEHLATSISQRVLIQLFATLSGRGLRVRSRERVLLAGVQGQHHVLGLRMVADVLEGAGFDVLYLGADIPVDSLRSFVDQHRPAIVGLTFGMATEVALLAESVWAIHEVTPQARIMLGGRAVPPAMAAAGYPCVSSSMDVVSTVERLLAGPPQIMPPIVETLRTGTSARSISGAPPAAEGETDAVAERWARASEDAVELARQHVRRAETYRDLAFRDPLTDLPNRRAFEDELSMLTTDKIIAGAVLMIDVDNFKTVNDTHGHGAGDRLLCSIAEAIARSVRDGDTPARVGGDEFAVILPGATSELASDIANRIRSAVAADTALPISVSVGVSMLTDDSRSAMLAADIALYEAKSAGRDRVVTSHRRPLSANLEGG